MACWQGTRAWWLMSDLSGLVLGLAGLWAPGGEGCLGRSRMVCVLSLGLLALPDVPGRTVFPWWWGLAGSVWSGCPRVSCLVSTWAVLSCLAELVAWSIVGWFSEDWVTSFRQAAVC